MIGWFLWIATSDWLIANVSAWLVNDSRVVLMLWQWAPDKRHLDRACPKHSGKHREGTVRGPGGRSRPETRQGREGGRHQLPLGKGKFGSGSSSQLPPERGGLGRRTMLSERCSWSCKSWVKLGARWSKVSDLFASSTHKSDDWWSLHIGRARRSVDAARWRRAAVSQLNPLWSTALRRQRDLVQNSVNVYVCLH